MLNIETVGDGDVSELLPMLRAYCDFYRVDPSDARLRAARVGCSTICSWHRHRVDRVPVAR
jgi:hypothetical protein